MADGVVVTGATGSINVSTDEAASGHVQRMKVCYSADGADTHVPADANGLTVQIAKDVSSTVGTQTSVTVGTTATLLIAASSTRKGVIFRTSGLIYLGYTSGVTTSTGLQVMSNEIWEEYVFKGALYAIVPSGTVNVRVLEAQ